MGGFPLEAGMQTIRTASNSNSRIGLSHDSRKAQDLLSSEWDIECEARFVHALATLKASDVPAHRFYDPLSSVVGVTSASPCSPCCWRICTRHRRTHGLHISVM